MVCQIYQFLIMQLHFCEKFLTGNKILSRLSILFIHSNPETEWKQRKNRFYPFSLTVTVLN